MSETVPIGGIQRLNDAFRRTLVGGRVVLSDMVASLFEEDRGAILQAVQSFNDFNEGNDPHEEHDCAIFDFRGQKLMWKIDYYDRNLEYHSPDPKDPTVTIRVLTICFAYEY